jgi:hypothetical protein
MEPSLTAFIRQFAAVVAAASAPVVLVAFLSIPYALNAPASAVPSACASAPRHMT